MEFLIVAFIAGAIMTTVAKTKTVPYAKEIIAEASKYMIPSSLALAQVKKESSFNPLALNAPENARGLLQVRSAALADVNKALNTHFTMEDLFNPTINLLVGFKYLDMQRNQFSSLYKGYIAYNAGASRVGTSTKGKQYADDIFNISKEYA